MTNIKIKNASRPSELIDATLAKSFFAKLSGLMFKNILPKNAGLLLADNYESRINSSIHMLFMNFNICVVWINRHYQVVDVQYARKWALGYFPKKPAQYTLELNDAQIVNFYIGDQLEFNYEE